MNTLYDKIETAEKFAAPPIDPHCIDHSEQVSFGLDYAKRMAEQPKDQPPVKQMVPIVPIAS